VHLVEPFLRLESQIRALGRPSRDAAKDLDALLEVYRRMFGIVFAIFGPAPTPELKSDLPFCLLTAPFTRTYPAAPAKAPAKAARKRPRRGKARRK